MAAQGSAAAYRAPALPTGIHSHQTARGRCRHGRVWAFTPVLAKEVGASCTGLRVRLWEARSERRSPRWGWRRLCGGPGPGSASLEAFQGILTSFGNVSSSPSQTKT